MNKDAEIHRLREGLKELYREKHDQRGFLCPNAHGECHCGLVEQNATIAFYLDPSNSKAEYDEQWAWQAAMERLNYLYHDYDVIGQIWADDPDTLTRMQDQTNELFNVLLAAQPWLVEGGDNGHV